MSSGGGKGSLRGTSLRRTERDSLIGKGRRVFHNQEGKVGIPIWVIIEDRACAGLDEEKRGGATKEDGLMNEEGGVST